MEVLTDLLYSARGEIIAGIFFALLGWVYSRFRKLTRLYKIQKQELERMTSEMQHLGATKQEFERLQEALRQAEAQHQEDEQRIIQLEREHERMQAELKRKDEALRHSEAQKAEEARRRAETQKQLEELQQELERIKTTKRQPTMSDEDFVELCRFGNARLVEKAIMNGANVNAKDNKGCTALMCAARNDKIAIAEILINHGADVNAKDNSGMTALILAVINNCTDTAQLLRRYGAKE